jgi:alpha-mannosidase
VLFNQFHDILGGTSLEAAYEDARDLHGEAMAIGSRGLNYAIQSLAWNIDIAHEEGMTPIVVFNPHSWPTKVDVEVDLGGLKPTDTLLDDQGNQIPMQSVRPPAVVGGWRGRMSFLADLPPLGYRVYRLMAGTLTHDPSPIVMGEGGESHRIENARFRLAIDPAAGCIASLYDKKHQVEVFRGAARAIVLDDPSDTWSHGVYQFHDAIGAFAARSVRLVEYGPVKSVLRVESEYGASRLTQAFTLYHELDVIEAAVTVDWREQFKALKLTFPVNLNFLKATYEIPYGHIVRPANGEEEPGQSWLDVSGEARGADIPYGVSLLNDGKYSFDVRDNELSLTVLRSPIYAHHHPTLPQPGELYSFIDQGIQRFHYAILPHAGSWEQAGTVRRAAELNQRPIALVETYHAGPLPQRDSYLSVDQETVVVSAVKRAEDGDDLVIRCYETAGAATPATIRLPKWGRTIETTLGPCEIKTFRIPRDSAQPVKETNMLEWDA